MTFLLSSQKPDSALTFTFLCLCLKSLSHTQMQRDIRYGNIGDEFPENIVSHDVHSDHSTTGCGESESGSKSRRDTF